MISRARLVTILGWVGSLLALTMYLSFIDQIQLNLSGHKGSWIIPLVGSVSCTVWTAYAWLMTPRNWPLIVCNVPMVILGPVTVITTFFF